jgi:hypothetical protein
MSTSFFIDGRDIYRYTGGGIPYLYRAIELYTVYIDWREDTAVPVLYVAVPLCAAAASVILIRNGAGVVHNKTRQHI